MAALKVRESFDINTLGGAFDLEGLIKAIQSKPASQRTDLENQILSLYGKAQSEGKDFCKGQFVGALKDWYERNPFLVILGGLGLGYLLVKLVKS